MTLKDNTETREFTSEEIEQVREAIRRARDDIDGMYKVDLRERFWQMNTPIGPGLRGWPHQRIAGQPLQSETKTMHYRNGREAHNGDKIISLAGYGSGPVNINAIGILFDAKPGNDHCNGSIASIIGGPVVGACLCDCLHLDDLAEILAKEGLDKRPPGK